MSMFKTASLEAFADSYPSKPVTIQHELAGHPLFALDRLAALMRALPGDRIEYNSGDGPIGQPPQDGSLKAAEAVTVLDGIGENKSWLALKNIERVPAYAALLDACLYKLAPLVRAATGALHKREAFLFVSSPYAVTPFHMDPEHNVLMQIQGAKRFYIFPATGLVSDEDHEAFHAGGGHRNLAYRNEYAASARAYTLLPGDSLYAPVKAPHWVRVGPDISVSLSITWRSAASDREAMLRRANGWLRAKGLTPPSPGVRPGRDRLAVLGARGAQRLSR